MNDSQDTFYPEESKYLLPASLNMKEQDTQVDKKFVVKRTLRQHKINIKSTSAFKCNDNLRNVGVSSSLRLPGGKIDEVINQLKDQLKVRKTPKDKDL